MHTNFRRQPVGVVHVLGALGKDPVAKSLSLNGSLFLELSENHLYVASRPVAQEVPLYQLDVFGVRASQLSEK